MSMASRSSQIFLFGRQLSVGFGQKDSRGQSFSIHKCKAFQNVSDSHAAKARNLLVIWDFKECLGVSSFEKGAQYLS